MNGKRRVLCASAYVLRDDCLWSVEDKIAPSGEPYPGTLTSIYLAGLWLAPVCIMAFAALEALAPIHALQRMLALVKTRAAQRASSRSYRGAQL